MMHARADVRRILTYPILKSRNTFRVDPTPPTDRNQDTRIYWVGSYFLARCQTDRCDVLNQYQLKRIHRAGHIALLLDDKRL